MLVAGILFNMLILLYIDKLGGKNLKRDYPFKGLSRGPPVVHTLNFGLTH